MHKTYLKALSCIVCISTHWFSIVTYAVVIDEKVAKEIEECLSRGSANTIYEYPAKDHRGYEPLTIAHSITWKTPATLALISKENIIIKPVAHITAQGSGNLFLKAGMENEKNKDYEKEPVGTVIFEDLSTPHIHIKEGKVRIYYNPSKGTEEHKFWNSSSILFEDQVSCTNNDNIETYMLVNHVRDLQDVRKALFKNYALSQDIDASETIDWDQGKGFRPLLAIHDGGERTQSFSRNFDGNGFTISNLFIDRPNENRVGLFANILGGWFERTVIENFTIKNSKISGGNYVGTLAGWAEDAIIKNVHIESSQLDATDITGGLIGAGVGIHSVDTSVIHSIIKAHSIYHGLIFGQIHDSAFFVTDYPNDTCADVTNIEDVNLTKKTPFGFLTKSVMVCANGKCILGSNELQPRLVNVGTWEKIT